MKKLLCVVLALVLMLGVVNLPAGAEEVLSEGDIFIEGDFRCKVVNDAVSIDEYLGKYGEDVNVVIPETIRGYTVKYIGGYSFGLWGYDVDFDKLKSVRLPDTIVFIGSGAFANLEADINLPVSLKYSFDHAFINNNFPEDLATENSEFVLLPESVEYLGTYAFSVSGIVFSENFIYTEGEPLGKNEKVDRMIGPFGSYGDQYCKANGIDFVASTYMQGDADENGMIDVADIMGIKKAIMDETFPVEYYDVDENGALDVADILACKNKIMEPKLATQEWLKTVWALDRQIG